MPASRNTKQWKACFLIPDKKNIAKSLHTAEEIAKMDLYLDLRHHVQSHMRVAGVLGKTQAGEKEWARCVDVAMNHACLRGFRKRFNEKSEAGEELRECVDSFLQECARKCKTKMEKVGKVPQKRRIIEVAESSSDEEETTPAAPPPLGTNPTPNPSSTVHAPTGLSLSPSAALPAPPNPTIDFSCMFILIDPSAHAPFHAQPPGRDGFGPRHYPWKSSLNDTRLVTLTLSTLDHVYTTFKSLWPFLTPRAFWGSLSDAPPTSPDGRPDDSEIVPLDNDTAVRTWMKLCEASRPVVACVVRREDGGTNTPLPFGRAFLATGQMELRNRTIDVWDEVSDAETPPVERKARKVPAPRYVTTWRKRIENARKRRDRQNRCVREYVRAAREAFPLEEIYDSTEDVEG